jgi:hypothetical protein
LVISANTHSPASRIIHSAPFAVRRFFVNEGQTRETTPQRLPAARLRCFFPAFSSGSFNANASFFLT